MAKPAALALIAALSGCAAADIGYGGRGDPSQAVGPGAVYALQIPDGPFFCDAYEIGLLRETAAGLQPVDVRQASYPSQPDKTFTRLVLAPGAYHVVSATCRQHIGHELETFRVAPVLLADADTAPDGAEPAPGANREPAEGAAFFRFEVPDGGVAALGELIFASVYAREDGPYGAFYGFAARRGFSSRELDRIASEIKDTPVERTPTAIAYIQSDAQLQRLSENLDLLPDVSADRVDRAARLSRNRPALRVVADLRRELERRGLSAP